MVIESRVPDISRELQVSNDVKNAESRQRSVTSSLSDDSTRKPNISQRESTSGKVSQGDQEPVVKAIDVHKAMEELNRLARSQKRDVSFSVDKEAEIIVIKITKTETGELIKQIPPEEILAMITRLRNNMGLLIDSKL